MDNPKLNLRFLTRRLVTAPTPAPDILVPIASALLAVVICTLLQTILPLKPPIIPSYQHVTYEYHQPVDYIYSTTVHESQLLADLLTESSSTITEDRTPQPPNCKVEKCLALTFDDGPSEHTDRLLDILQQNNAKASFFALGHRVWAFSGQIARIANEGHDIGNHSWIHRNLPTFPYATVLDDLTGTTNALQQVTSQPVRFFRPPYGNAGQKVSEITTSLNQQIVLWTIDPRDWQDKDAATICNRVTSGAHQNAIVLMHDIYASSVDAVPCILDRLKSEYKFVNLTTLFN